MNKIICPSWGIACDFDGTLVNTSKEFGINKLRLTALHFGFEYTEAMAERAVRAWGMKLNDLFLLVFLGISEQTAQDMHDHFELLDMQLPPSLFPGISEALAELSAREAALTILSSRYAATLHSILEFRAVRHHFCHIASLDSVVAHKPDPRSFDCTAARFRELGIPEDRWVYIGDTAVDLETGRALGIRTIIVETGFGSQHIVSDTPFETLASLADLPGLLFDKAACPAAS